MLLHKCPYSPGFATKIFSFNQRFEVALRTEEVRPRELCRDSLLDQSRRNEEFPGHLGRSPLLFVNLEVQPLHGAVVDLTAQ